MESWQYERLFFLDRINRIFRIIRQKNDEKMYVNPVKQINDNHKRRKKKLTESTKNELIIAAKRHRKAKHGHKKAQKIQI